MHTTFLATVDKLASVHSLSSDEGFTPQFVAIWVPEHNFGEGSTTSRVVDDVLQHNKIFYQNLILKMCDKTQSFEHPTVDNLDHNMI